MMPSAASPQAVTPAEALAELARRELARRHLLDWCRYIQPGYLTPPHIELLAGKLEAVERGAIKRLMVFMPPRHGKSNLVSEAFPPWYIGRDPSRRVIQASYGAELVADFTRASRNFLLEFGPSVFGVEVAQDSKAADRWGIAGHRGGTFGAGVGGPLTGRGGDVLLIDDPFKDAQEAYSELRRQRVWDWYTAVARTRLQKGGAIVIVLTRWYEDDLAGRLLEQDRKGEGEDWEVLSLPAIAEEGDLLGREPGEALWPEMFPVEALDPIRRASTRVWLALYQQRPTAASGNVFKKTWWRFYRRAELPKLTRVILSVDATFKDDKAAKGTPDFVVIQAWGQAGAAYYLLDQARGQWDFPKTLEVLRQVSKRYPKALAKLVEDKANGPAIISTMKRQMPGLIAVEPEGGKIARANAVAPLAEAHNVYLPDPTEPGNAWVEEELLPELGSFPRGKNDDQVDALTQALTYLGAADIEWLRRLTGSAR